MCHPAATARPALAEGCQGVGAAMALLASQSPEVLLQFVPCLTAQMTVF